jgi:hypothetical protein
MSSFRMGGAWRRYVLVLAMLLLLGPFVVLIDAVEGEIAYAPGGQEQESFVTALAPEMTTIAFSPNRQFVGAAGDSSYLFVGLLNGTVLQMDRFSGRISRSVRLPDGNSAAHLVYYDGSLYVGTEWLHGARDAPLFHVYQIEPRGMSVVRQLAMNSPYANGFVVAFGGFLWAGDGHCTLYKIDPSTLQVKGTVAHVAEDEMTFDGKNYWAECKNEVHVLHPSMDLPVEVAVGSLVLPDRPRGFFTIGSSVFASGTLDSTLYSMFLSGNAVDFKNVGTLPPVPFLPETPWSGEG